MQLLISNLIPNMGNILLGLFIVGIGFLCVWKADWIVNNFGRVPWAEEHLGTEGGSRIFWKLLGILIIILGFGITTGLWQPLFARLTSPMFRGFTPES